MKYKNIFAIKTLFTLLVLSAIFTTSCSFSEFSRQTAAKAIQEDKRYSNPIAYTIDIGRRIADAGAEADQASKDETEPEAAVRAKANFSQRQPQLAVAEQLGYITIDFGAGELGEPQMGHRGYQEGLGVWHFKPKATLTDKGKRLWTDLNLEIDEFSLPIAVRETLAIDGIADQNPNMKKVDFSFKWQPNALGEAFDPNTSTFSKLPKELQESLKTVKQNIFGGGGNNIADFSTTRKGFAYFQKYDDGWRISNLAFL
ncbi:MAG: hypothetical protein LUM44_07685 [Pyrinomonadaceae bacterium]|nr:hypothetical protein [Pyrinomonadaceae bacterium]